MVSSRTHPDRSSAVPIQRVTRATERGERLMPTRLVSLDGHGDIPIDQILVVVGRHTGCDVRLESARVSRRHCCIGLDREGVLIRDLGSTNGTRINGQRIETGLLRPGNELVIAHLRYRLEMRLEDESMLAPIPYSAPND